MRGPLAILLALLAAPAAAQVIDCNAQGFSEGADFTACRAAAWGQADAELNRVWPEAMEGASRYGVDAALLDAQRAWLGFRDAHCAVGSALDAGAYYEQESLHICLTELTITRTEQLLYYTYLGD